VWEGSGLLRSVLMDYGTPARMCVEVGELMEDETEATEAIWRGNRDAIAVARGDSGVDQWR
jgi:hypothetical protein